MHALGHPCSLSNAFASWQTVQLQVWDTAGMERFSVGSVGGAFYRGSDGCLIVYDVTDSESFEQVLLETINSFFAWSFTPSFLVSMLRIAILLLNSTFLCVPVLSLNFRQTHNTNLKISAHALYLRAILFLKCKCDYQGANVAQ